MLFLHHFIVSSGHFAKVKLGRSILTGEKVAIKCVNKRVIISNANRQGKNGKEQTASIHREMAMLTAMKHVR